MPPIAFGKGPPASHHDELLKELIASMTRQPTPGTRKAWALNYVPPKHLRLPDYTYDYAEDSGHADEVGPVRGRQTLLQRKLTSELTKVMSSMSLSQLDEDEQHNSEVSITLQGNSSDIESACVNHQNPRPELLLPCSMSAYSSQPGHFEDRHNIL